MLFISEIHESKKVHRYLLSRQLIDQYRKSKQMILSGNPGIVDFKKRQPIQKGIWSFRINKQFRALCRIENDILLVVGIDNHQNY